MKKETNLGTKIVAGIITIAIIIAGVVALGWLVAFLWGVVMVPVFGLITLTWKQGLALLLLCSILLTPTFNVGK